MIIEKTLASNIEEINELSPEHWTPIGPKIALYVSLPFCHSVKITENHKIISVGTAVFYKDTGWLAHIIVKDSCRNRGIGTYLIKHLCDFCKLSGCKSISLFATEMGYPLYKKYGFKVHSEYAQYTKAEDVQRTTAPNVREIKADDVEAIFCLDKRVAGEDRKELLRNFTHKGFVCIQKNEVAGYYLSELGEGVIIAENEIAGLELAKLRNKVSARVTLPVDNHIGNIFYKENGFKEVMKIKRLVYGERIECENKKVYNRIGGNFG